MNSLTLDIILIAFLLIMALFGYIKGFITRLYDFVSLVFVIYVSVIFSKPLSHMVNIYPESINNEAVMMVSQVLNQIIVFVVLLVGLFIVKVIAGIIIKPLLKGLVHKFSLTKFTDQTLGLVLGLVEGFIISYVAILLMMTPISSMREQVEESKVASVYMQLVPSIANDVVELSDGLTEMNINHSSNESIMKVLLTAYDLNLVDNEQVNTLMQNYLSKELQKKNVSLTLEDYNQFKDIMENIDYNSDEMNKILSNINVSDE